MGYVKIEKVRNEKELEKLVGKVVEFADERHTEKNQAVYIGRYDINFGRKEYLHAFIEQDNYNPYGINLYCETGRLKFNSSGLIYEDNFGMRLITPDFKDHQKFFNLLKLNCLWKDYNK